MLISWNMLNETLSIPATLEEVAERLTLTGCEVESVERPCAMVKDVQVAQIESLGRHPEKENLFVASVRDGIGTAVVVTAAPNLSEGDRVPYGRPGSVLADGTVLGTRECCFPPRNWAYPRLRTSSAFSAFPETLPWAATW